MKKLTALMMALLLCVACVSAMAEGTQLYTHPTQGYSISVPAEWLCLDKTNVDSLIAAYENGEMTFTGTNAETLKQLKPQVESTDCAVLINPLANNVVLVKENMGMELTNDQFVSMLIPMFRTQLVKQMPSLEFTSEGEVIAAGENEFIVLSGTYQINGITASVDMLFCLDGSDLYTLSLTTTSLFGEEALNTFYEEVFAACATFAIAK
ncbi:MAG: hypothetical protein IKJ51_10735 [Clostridia bacterium]|nr:hypothetical protein [Clostridia bacterium]MBR6808743.1 hypothetical protein [Clostridia bacterium]